MKHTLRVEGRVFRLRPVTLEDAEFLVDLRTDESRARYINPTPPEIGRQLQWLAAYEDRPGDYYFIIEKIATGKPEGAAGIYNVDEASHAAEWGRWVVLPGSAAALETVPLIYRAAFEMLGMESLYSRTIRENLNSISIIERFGMVREKDLPGFIELRGTSYDGVQHRVTRGAWDRLRSGARP